MNTKNRIEKLERMKIPKSCYMVVWEDPDKKGVYYDRPYSSPDRKTYTDEDLKPLRENSNDVLFTITLDQGNDHKKQNK